MFTRRWIWVLGCLLPAAAEADDGPVSIRADFPGGNIVVVKNADDEIELAPDLRGGPSWFYWHFEAETKTPCRVNFSFAKPPMIGVRGPAVSRDAGHSWQWLGADQVTYGPPVGEDKTTPRYDRFRFDFTEPGQKVRFAVAIPYLQHDLDAFLDRYRENPHLTRSVLTHTRLEQRRVDLIQIGEQKAGVSAVLLTARHHACESMASYVLEGFLEEALSESPAGEQFRRRHVLYAVPLVDTDGVQQGDQGKNRLPHDHNRDYGDTPIYPEIRAIQELVELKNIQFSLDLHCPFLRGDIHEAFHFVGLGIPHIKDNLREWSAWLKEERPQSAMTPIDLLKDPNKPNALDRRINSHYLATRANTTFAVCLEIPYAQVNCPLDEALAREYGRSLLRAWVWTRFLPAGASSARGDDDHGLFAAFREGFVKAYRSNPEAAEALARPYLQADATPLYAAEAHNLLTLLRLHQRRFSEALQHAEVSERHTHATANQRATTSLLRLQTVARDPQSSPGDVIAALARWQRLSYPASEQRAKAFEFASEFFHKHQDYATAIKYTRQQREAAASYEQGRLLNHLATMQDELQQPDEAIQSRKEAVAFLRARLNPAPPRSVFGAMMAFDLFEALAGIPTATREERRAAAEMVLEHEVASASLKAKVRQKLAELGE